MSPAKRSASPSPPNSTLAKKPKAAKPLGSFPYFDDGDAAISVGDLQLNLHSRTLSNTCDYFSKFDSTKFPERFTLKPNSLSLGHDADRTMAFSVVSPADTDGNEVEAANDDDNRTARTTTTVDALMKRAKAANETIFRILYRQPLRWATPVHFRDAAALATRYGCVDAVKDALVTGILKASLRATIFEDDPWALLNAGYSLRDEAIFSEALLHVVGRGSGGDELLPAVLTDLVDKQTDDLEAKVRRCWQAAMRCCRGTDDISQAIAATLMRSYLDQHLACALGSPLRPEVYGVMAALYCMDNIKPLLQARLMEKLNRIDHALVARERIIDAQGPDRYDHNFSYAARIMAEWFQECVNGKRVEGALRDMLIGIKEAIKPLFEGSRNVGYFTCIDFAGPFPWPNVPPGSP